MLCNCYIYRFTLSHRQCPRKEKARTYELVDPRSTTSGTTTRSLSASTHILTVRTGVHSPVQSGTENDRAPFFYVACFTAAHLSCHSIAEANWQTLQAGNVSELPYGNAHRTACAPVPGAAGTRRHVVRVCRYRVRARRAMRRLVQGLRVLPPAKGKRGSATGQRFDEG